MGHKKAYATNTKFKNALRKSVSENKDFLLELAKEENIELRWMQNQSDTKTLTGFKISMTPSNSSVTLSDRSITIIPITEEVSSQTSTLENRNIKLLKV